MFKNKWGNWKDIVVIERSHNCNALIQMRIHENGKKQFRTVGIKGSIYSKDIPVLDELITNK